MHHAVARQRRVLLVQGDDPAAQPLVLQRAAQHPGRGDRLAVVGEADRPDVAQLGHLGQLLAAQAAGDARQEAGRHPGPLRRLGDQRVDDRRGVDGRDRVRHRDDRAEAARGGGGRAGVDVLLVLLAGRAQVHVRVDERREQVLAGGVDGVGAVGRRQRAGGADLGDLAAADQDVVGAVDAGPRIEHVGVADQDVGAGAGP